METFLYNIDVTGIILCGGKSRRMGSDKATLLFNKTPFVKLIADQLSFCREIMLSVGDLNKYSHFGIPCILDRWENCGPLSGVCSSLFECKTELALVVACDMPLFTEDLGKKLAGNLTSGFDAVVPISDDGMIHPLCACYRTNLAGLMMEQLNNNKLRFCDFLDSIKVLYLPVHDNDTLKNINYSDEYSRLFFDNH